MAFHVSLGDTEAVKAVVNAINNGADGKKISQDVKTIDGKVIAIPHKESDGNSITDN